jgi:RHS repeat-associated protein
MIGGKTTDYCGNVIYENGILKRILVDGGYIEGGTYYFYLTDHLGNNRVVANASGTVLQTNHYYPFGLSFMEGIQNSLQPYKYSGKELDTDRGLNLYDYSARYMDPALGRFNTMDPMTEKYYSISPYAYCGGNPVNRIDPYGREWKEKKDEEIAKQLQQQIASRDKSLAKQEQKINAQIDKIANNTKLSTEKRDQQIAKQQGKLEDVQTQRTQLSNLDKGITRLGDSKTSYTFNTVEAGTTATLSSMSDGTVVINNYGTTGNRAHETTHAIQYDNGQIKFNPLGSNNTLMQNPMGLEIQAYATEYSITNGIVPSSDAKYPRTVFGITPQWLYGLKDPNTGIYIYRPENYK